MHAVEAVGVAAVTLGLVIARPRGLNEGLAALLGGALVLLLELVASVQADGAAGKEWRRP